MEKLERHILVAETIVLMMTAFGEQASIQEALPEGAYQCIRKPFDIFALESW